MAALLLMGAGGVEASEKTVWSGSGQYFTIEASAFKGVSEGTILRVYLSGTQTSVQYGKFGTAIWQTQCSWGSNGYCIVAEDSRYDSVNGCFVFTMDADQARGIAEKGISFNATGGSGTITKVTVEISSADPSKENVTLAYSATEATATLGQSFTAPTLKNPSNVTVTYSSSNTSVATIATNGAVTLVGEGSTTIKASYAGDDTHNPAEASYTLTVSKQELALSFPIKEVTVKVGDAFAAPHLQASVPQLAYVYTSSNPDVVSVDASTGVVTIRKKGSAVITASYAGDDIYEAASASYTIYVKDFFNFTMNAYGYATLSSTKPLDLNQTDGLVFYIAKSVDAGRTVVTMSQVFGTVPAGTGLLVKGQAGETYRIEVAEDEGSEIASNLLVAASSETTINSTNDYVLTIKDDVVQFAHTGNAQAVVAAGKAYLHVAGSNARRMRVAFDSDATGIDNVLSAGDTQKKQGIYNLGGQRVSTPGKGLYIVNGKKVFFK